mmetsp:Transcript_32251/g.100151  ORF Transcript_32251/g.100151 Transcript_32251/m.100151 type:complete len:399 (+) Transcript_32251:101-1297(+)
MDALDPQAFQQVDEKGFVPDDVRNAFFRKLRMKTENRSCFECSARNPTWISLSYGVYLCLECSGEHRRKGVHISFVRSVELDRFSPDQMLQMGMGGNGKAWNYFKSHGMGKTSDNGRPPEYTSKVAQRYKQALEKDTKDACAKLNVACKAAAQAPAAVDPVDEAADFPGQPPSPTNLQSFKSAPAVVQSAPSAPAAQPKPTAAAPASVVVRRAAPPEPAASPSSPSAPAPAPAKTGFVAGSKQMAKQIEFDFDFDELESEASKPAPAPPPKAAAPAPAPAPAPSVTKPPVASMAAPPHSRSASEVEGSSKFAKSKAICSDDFFADLESETASARVDREERYNKFSSSAAISSDSFFGNGDPDDMARGHADSGDWKAAASDYARKGAEILTTYLNKVRD